MFIFLFCFQLLLFFSLSVSFIQAVCLRRGCALGSSSALMVSITRRRQYHMAQIQYILCSETRKLFCLRRPVSVFLALDDLIVISGSSLDTAALLHPASATTQQETNAHSYIIYTAGTFTSFLISYQSAVMKIVLVYTGGWMFVLFVSVFYIDVHMKIQWVPKVWKILVFCIIFLFHLLK